MTGRAHVKRNSHADEFVVLIVVILVIIFREKIILFALAGMAGWAVWRLDQHFVACRNRRMVRAAAISMQADHEMLMYSMGDPVGTYGRYDAYTMPVTRPAIGVDASTEVVTRMNLDDYNDGLRDWR